MRGGEGDEVRDGDQGPRHVWPRRQAGVRASAPRARHGKMAACLRKRAEARAQGRGRGVSAWDPALCVGGNSGILVERLPRG